MQEDHDVAHRLLLLPAFADLLDALPADALDLRQERRAFIDDLQGAFAEDLDDLVGVMGADPLDEAGAKKFLDAFDRVGRSRLERLGLKLPAMLGIFTPGAGRLQILAGHHARHLADDGDQIALPLHLHAQHGETILRIVEGDALDDAGNRVHHQPQRKNGQSPPGWAELS